MSTIRHLVDYFVPEHYQLDLTIQPQAKILVGQVTITGTALKEQLRLHAKNLEIIKVRTDQTNTPGWHIDDTELVIDGKASRVTIDYQAKLSDTAMNGLYLSSYQVEGKSHTLFATQFESHYARECFPCIDEPAAKATFDLAITVDHPDITTVLSNMPGVRKGQTWRFRTTPRMSTYLLAFVGGNFVSQTASTKRGVQISAYATSNHSAELLNHALDIATRSVDFYEEYFGVDYPLSKLDNVALPNFSAGAMENWGLITYRESALLADNDAAETTKEYIATVVAHEIAHQWFGNLVTMRWWDDLWLNESFASLMENTTTDHLHPEYQIWDDFETSDVLAALTQDSLPGVQAVRQDVESPDEIATLFDGAIVYAKGERLVKMLRALVGEATFRRAIKHYLTKHQYRNAVADDLWQVLATESKLDISSLMQPWLTRPNFPIVKASLLSPTKLQLEQTSLNSQAPDDLRPIPLLTDLANCPGFLTERQLTINIPADRLVHLNLGDNAHYLVDYDDTLLARIIRHFHQLEAIDRSKLLQGSLLLSQLDRTDINPALQLLQAASGETNQATLTTIARLTGQLDRLVEPDSADHNRLKQFVASLFDAQLHQLLQAKTHLSINDRKARPIVLARSVYGESRPALDYCQTAYDAHESDISRIDADIRSVVLGAIIKQAKPGAFDRLWRIYLASDDVALRQDICDALTGTRNANQVATLLNNATKTKLIRPQDNISFIASLMMNRRARSTTWQWIRDEWQWIEQMFSGDMIYDSYVHIAGRCLSTAGELAEYDRFFSQINAPALSRTIKLGHNDIVRRLRWIKRNQPILTDFLQQRL